MKREREEDEYSEIVCGDLEFVLLGIYDDNIHEILEWHDKEFDLIETEWFNLTKNVPEEDLYTIDFETGLGTVNPEYRELHTWKQVASEAQDQLNDGESPYEYIAMFRKKSDPRVVWMTMLIRLDGNKGLSDHMYIKKSFQNRNRKDRLKVPLALLLHAYTAKTILDNTLVKDYYKVTSHPYPKMREMMLKNGFSDSSDGYIDGDLEGDVDVLRDYIAEWKKNYGDKCKNNLEGGKRRRSRRKSRRSHRKSRRKSRKSLRKSRKSRKTRKSRKSRKTLTVPRKSRKNQR